MKILAFLVALCVSVPCFAQDYSVHYHGHDNGERYEIPPTPYHYNRHYNHWHRQWYCDYNGQCYWIYR